MIEDYALIGSTTGAGLVHRDGTIAWLALPRERRPHVITTYFSNTDAAGHDAGPLSPQVDTAARRVDAMLGRLLDGLARLPDVRDRAYLVLVSDHGMSETHPRWFARLDTLIDTAGVRLGEAGPLANITVQGGEERAGVMLIGVACVSGARVRAWHIMHLFALRSTW